jgi:hypothetical protein
VTSAELTALLQEFYRDKLALRERHVAGARRVSHYNFNNTYQYVINREDTQLGWLREVLEESSAPVPPDAPALPVPDVGKGDAAQAAIIADDARLAGEFEKRWRARVDGMSNARHRTMLSVILGEELEQKRFFEQMIAGREDVLGRRTGGPSTGGGVLPVRWLRTS